MGTSGSGLGLSVVYGVVKDHLGYYDVFSAADMGTEFVLYFPICDKTVEEKPQVGDAIFGTETILVVDDNEEQRVMAREILLSLGYQVEAVNNGHEAVAHLRQNDVDLIVLDMIMEDGFDGLDTYREILKHRPGQKAVIVSGFSATERVQEMQVLGAGTYIRKPYSHTTIARAIREELDKTSVCTGASAT